MQRNEGRIVSLTAPKKSRTRTGCARCKQLHHKCTEERPRCMRCVKFNSSCVYAEPLRSKDGHHINNVRQSTASARARQSKQCNMHSTSSEGSPNSSGSSPPIEVVLYSPSDTRQRDSMGIFLHQFANMAEYMNSEFIRSTRVIC
ncbi:hypothetical protein BCR37DRAFT_382197 [Protomyces lactucae-debilis]|uniref:Zn(2)-C6 fungal-type domain-containing protein n=1 Tax=Protomyces lactucae-debilis TaxID=2754530 RepID=A0A1Y2F5D3_PROLT|nr:uncharacterized protein BCR37DRAFT_382197 [Protomyces lactucae-debilis]ORY78556.1 hypothetical protein BCR37DRAFT_382197 [Protomyces lactucae-debilis]